MLNLADRPDVKSQKSVEKPQRMVMATTPAPPTHGFLCRPTIKRSNVPSALPQGIPPIEETKHSGASIFEALRTEIELPRSAIAFGTLYADIIARLAQLDRAGAQPLAQRRPERSVPVRQRQESTRSAAWIEHPEPMFSRGA